MQQTTSTVLMVRPEYFSFNEETAVSNAFQRQVTLQPHEIKERVLAEFDGFVNLLREKNIEVIVIHDTAEPLTPDSVFPNNWVMFHPDGNVTLFPMEALSRRAERRTDILEDLGKTYDLKKIEDLSGAEAENRFLEGTGSMVFDHRNKTGYACLSPRTDQKLFEEFCAKHGYRAVSFHSVDENRKAIYHTNVMMCVGKKLAVICLDSIPDTGERQQVVESLRLSGLEIVEISFEQMNRFAGNMLQLTSTLGEEFLVMSDQAYRSLREDQLRRIEKHTEIIHPPLYTIEEIGGGSARCMMAEVFLPKK